MMEEMHTFVVLAYKESQYLEHCIKSVLNQTIKTNVVIATSTPNKYIDSLAKKYNLDIIVNNKTKGIASDFDFAFNVANTKLVTVAHQDDIYETNYAEEVLKYYNKYKKSIILFSNYFEIKNDNREYKNTNLRVKEFLLFPLRFKTLSGIKMIKRSALRFGDAICCPSVTFVKANCPNKVFVSDMKCNVDWQAWEMLSKLKGKFIYIAKPLMGHRIHAESTTTEIIKENKRTEEDFIMFKKFWPTFIAKILTKIYSKSEQNNNV